MTLAENLERLRRYAPATADPADPAAVLAMPIVLHIRKADPPERGALLEAAAQATVLACLDPRASAGGEWAPAFDAWCAGRIRKIARRARGAQWAAVQDLPGVTVGGGVEEDGGVEEGGGTSGLARAFVPGPVGETDRRLAKLQIGGTDVDGNLPTAEPTDGELVLWVAPALPMTVGKLAAQVSHASMLGAPLMPDPASWFDSGCKVAVRQADARRWAELLDDAAAGRAVAVRDAGYTEVAPGSCTVIARQAPGA